MSLTDRELASELERRRPDGDGGPPPNYCPQCQGETLRVGVCRECDEKLIGTGASWSKLQALYLDQLLKESAPGLASALAAVLASLRTGSADEAATMLISVCRRLGVKP